MTVVTCAAMEYACDQMRLLRIEPGTNNPPLEQRGGGLQAGSPPLLAKYNVVKYAVTNGSFMLPSVLSLECPPYMFVINETAQTINIYPFTGEYMNGVQNAVQAMTTLQIGIFIPVQNALMSVLSATQFGAEPQMNWKAMAMS